MGKSFINGKKNENVEGDCFEKFKNILKILNLTYGFRATAFLSFTKYNQTAYLLVFSLHFTVCQ